MDAASFKAFGYANLFLFALVASAFADDQKPCELGCEEKCETCKKQECDKESTATVGTECKPQHVQSHHVTPVILIPDEEEVLGATFVASEKAPCTTGVCPSVSNENCKAANCTAGSKPCSSSSAIQCSSGECNAAVASETATTRKFTFRTAIGKGARVSFTTDVGEPCGMVTSDHGVVGFVRICGAECGDACEKDCTSANCTAATDSEDCAPCKACCKSIAGCTNTGCVSNPSEKVATAKTHTGVVAAAHAVGDLLIKRPKVTARLAVHGIVPELKLGHVIVCGHKICTSSKCYEVEDAPVVGKSCDTQESQDEEQILIVPVAPPIPAAYEMAATHVDPNQPAPQIVHQSLRGANVTLPASTVVEMLLAQTELSTRLELTQQLLSDREAFSQQIQTLADRNAKLSTQLAVLESRSHFADALTASVMERAELAVRLAAIENRGEPNPASAAPKTQSMNSIQEDLANIRRQIALLKRQQPVPFAPSYVGSVSGHMIPYVPILDLPVAPELTTEPSQTAVSPSETIVK